MMSPFFATFGLSGFHSDPTGLPAGATGYVNFSAGTYYFDNSQSIDDVFGSDGYFTDTIAPEEINASGWAPPARSSTAFLGQALAVLVAGCTFVIDTNMLGDSSLSVEMLDRNTFDPDLIVVLGTAASGNSTVVSADGTSTTDTNDPEFMSAGTHRVACTMTDGKIAASIDGAAIIEMLYAWPNTPGSAGLTFEGAAGSYVSLLTFYPVQTNAALITLSTL